MDKEQELRKIMDVFKEVAHFSLALWFEDNQHVCASASAGAAQALRMLGIDDARPIFVSGLAGNESREDVISFGHNQETASHAARELLGAAGVKFTHPPIQSGHKISDHVKAYPFHVAVRVKHGEAVWLLDLTIGQINHNNFGLNNFPGGLYMEGEWPAYGFGDGNWILYTQPAYPDELDPKILAITFNGLAEDLHDTARLALQVGVAPAKKLLRQIMPTAFAAKRAEQDRTSAV